MTEKYLPVNGKYRWFISLERDYTYCFLEKLSGKSWFFGENWVKTSEHLAVDFIDNDQSKPSRHLRPGCCLVGVIHGRYRRVSIVEFDKTKPLKDYLLTLAEGYFQRISAGKANQKQIENIINNL